MIALFDSGSTRLHFSYWDGTALKDAINITYPDSIKLLRNIVSDILSEIIPEKIAACSVSSKWRECLFETINTIVPGKLVVARTASDLGMKVSYDKPETYGIDRALAAYGAFHVFQNSCVVVDAGTAVTIDAINSDGAVIGGYIFPGSEMLANALSSNTDLPPVHRTRTPVRRTRTMEGGMEGGDVSTGDVNEGIGNSTETCIKYGITMGFTAAVNHLIKNAIDSVGSDNRVLITGGGAEVLKKYLTFPVKLKPDIVLETLGLIADKLPKY